jgi:hypothetical protein
MILFAILLMTIGFVSIFYNVLQEKNTGLYPYKALIPFLMSMLIFIYISFVRKYIIHLIFYIVSLLCIIGIIALKNRPNA